MSLAGHLLGPATPQAALAKVAVGGAVPERLSVHGRVVYLVWPIAVLLGALVILWGRAPEPRDEAGGDDGSGSETGTASRRAPTPGTGDVRCRVARVPAATRRTDYAEPSSFDPAPA